MTESAKAIALGLGDNTDYELFFDCSILEAMAKSMDIHLADIRNVRQIKSSRDLVCSILYFMLTATGGERFIEDESIIERFSAAFGFKITIGGTAPRAAIFMAKLGYRSYLHLVTINDHIRKLLPEGCEYVCSNDRDSSFPHLIIQYTQGMRIRFNDIDILTERANRIIFDNDADNIVMKLSDRYFDGLDGARVLLLSGFNAMQDRALLEGRLAFMVRRLEQIPEETTVFYEDACFYSQDFTRLVWDRLIPHIDIYSLNEDELQAYIGCKMDLLDPEAVLRGLSRMNEIVSVPTLIVHTRYWALAYGADARKYRRALKAGITSATTRFRFGDDFTVVQYAETERLPDEAEGAAFARALERLSAVACCVPSVTVTESKVTTIGLGDAFVGGVIPVLAEGI